MTIQRKARIDALDKIILIIGVVVFCLALPLFIGERNTPYIGGQPAMLNPQIRAEQKFIADSHRALNIISDTHKAIAVITPAAGATESYAGSQIMQTKVETIESMITEWKRITPPGRFAGLYKRLGDALAGYQRIATEAWAYYGDLNAAHLTAINQALPAGASERAEIERLLNSMDFAMQPSIEAKPITPQQSSQPAQPNQPTGKPTLPAFSK